jgi:5'-nucleotidase (lipoprotein e(P4) family)
VPRGALAIALLAVCPASVAAQRDHLELKWMRDSEEYVAIFRQTYRLAGDAVERQAGSLPRGTVWAVVLDLDETVLDNSIYQVERAAYGLAYDSLSWDAWVRRMRADSLPGAPGFIGRVRELGGRIAYISGRDDVSAAATRQTLAALGLWRETDRLCLDTSDRVYTKRARREELRTGVAPCGYPGERVRVLAYLGDNIADLPEADEEPGELGVTWFVLPNPSYGGWERRVTRGTRLN